MLCKAQVDCQVNIILNNMSHNQTMKQKHGTCSQANTHFKTSFIIKRHNGNLFKTLNHSQIAKFGCKKKLKTTFWHLPQNTTIHCSNRYYLNWSSRRHCVNTANATHTQKMASRACAYQLPWRAQLSLVSSHDQSGPSRPGRHHLALAFGHEARRSVSQSWSQQGCHEWWWGPHPALEWMGG